MTTPHLLFSSLLAERGVAHAFPTRRGGVSQGVFDSLNFGNPADLPTEQRDPRSNILANWARVAAAIGCPAREIVEVHQVHGAAVHGVWRGSATHPGLPEGTSTKADALVTDDPGRLLAVRVADCAPVLVASEDGSVVAAVHAGWRGVVADVAGAAVRGMIDRGGRGLVAAIGPCIGPGALEVGVDVAEQIRLAADAARAAPPAVTPHGDRFLADLPRVLEAQLRAAGVGDVETLHRCTVREPEWFFSHRRDRGLTGRMAGVIGVLSS